MNLHLQNPFKNGSLSQTGFTLIEVLVVFSVITILTGIGVVSMVSYSQNQQMNQAALKIKLMINEARANALDAVKSNRSSAGVRVSCGNEKLISYSVSFYDEKSIDLFMVCEGSSSSQIERFATPRDIVFDQTTTCDEIEFGARNSGNSGLPCNYVIKGFGITKTLQIDGNGNVEVQ